MVFDVISGLLGKKKKSIEKKRESKRPEESVIEESSFLSKVGSKEALRKKSVSKSLPL